MKCAEAQAMLDRLMDGELSEEERQALSAHGQGCPECAAAIRATMQMKALFEEMEPEVEVPLPAQAKWRQAVRVEAKRRSERTLYRRIGAAAAAVAVLAGAGWALNRDAASPAAVPHSAMVVEEEAVLTGAASEAADAEVAYEAAAGEFADAGAVVVEADGAVALEDEEAPMLAVAANSPVQEIAVEVEDVDAACGLIEDLVQEYEGTVDVQSSGDGANLYVELSPDNVDDFISALAPMDPSGEVLAAPESAEGDLAALLIVVRPAK
ncbi:MAG: zf-HC2 domain-containing protein [Clostridia bacterium]|nr:zf-HC2 domain-containing protein [Clostridia bacterium]